MKRETIQTLSRFFGLCAIFGLILVYLWFGLYSLPNGFICDLSFRFFDTSPHECALVNYGGIALLKIMVVVFFLFPWIALRVELMRKS